MKKFRLTQIDDYKPLVGAVAIKRLKEKAETLQDLHVVNINSTYYGGGVAQLLSSETLLMNSLGIKTGWRVIQGSPDFFTITKKMHNALQGAKINLTARKMQIYEDVIYENAVRNHLDHDVVIVHDPQPLPMINHYRKDCPWIWRCHIDLSAHNETLWSHLLPYVEKYDAVILSCDEYKQDINTPQLFFLPAIDPFTITNRELGEQEIKERLAHYNIPFNRPLVVQISLKSALKWGLISRNPADAVTPPRGRQSEMQIWNETEMTRFLKEAESTRYYELFYLALFTGMRRSELLALRWSNIDFIYSQIYVNRGLHHLKNGSYVFTEPKSAKSRRAITLSPSTVLMLKSLYEKQVQNMAMLHRTLNDDDMVFYHLDGNPLRPNTITHAWVVTAKRAGVNPIRLHDARHTHASLLLKQGIHPKIVQERLGHSSIEITLDTYSHVAPGMQAAAAARFDEAFKNNVEYTNVPKHQN